MTPIIKYTQKVKHKGEDYEVTGEVFPNVLKKSENTSIYSQIEIKKVYHIGDVVTSRQTIDRVYFAAQLSEDDLKKNVDHISQNLNEYVNSNN